MGRIVTANGITIVETGSRVSSISGFTFVETVTTGGAGVSIDAGAISGSGSISGAVTLSVLVSGIIQAQASIIGDSQLSVSIDSLPVESISEISGLNIISVSVGDVISAVTGISADQSIGFGVTINADAISSTGTVSGQQQIDVVISADPILAQSIIFADIVQSVSIAAAEIISSGEIFGGVRITNPGMLGDISIPESLDISSVYVSIDIVNKSIH